MPLDSSVELEEVAEKTNDCTGADLKALLYNAQLQVAHETLKLMQETKDPVLPTMASNKRGVFVFEFTSSGLKRCEKSPLEEKV